MVTAIFSDDFYDEISPDIDEYFDTSDYQQNNVFNIPLRHKKVIGKVKDENCGKIITEFGGLGPKNYSFTLEDEIEVKKATWVKSVSLIGIRMIS